jgi:transposase-like protein
MTRDETNAMWQARWQGLRASGLTMTEYAHREGFNAPSAYRWLRRARSSGKWSDSESGPIRVLRGQANVIGSGS